MDSYRQQANLLRLLAHPARLQILDMLRRDEECVCHLSALLHKPQPYVSQQLSVLRTAGLITDEKDGTNVFYRLADPHVAECLEGILGPLSNGHAGHRPEHVATEGCACPKCRNGQ
jgi:DNA-binding transcriptional ArsR family regulator